MASVSITSPLGGTTVARQFTATGTYSPFANGDAKPCVHMDDANGQVALAAIKTNGVGGWTGKFTMTANYVGLILVAELTATDAIESNINVQG